VEDRIEHAHNESALRRLKGGKQQKRSRQLEQKGEHDDIPHSPGQVPGIVLFQHVRHGSLFLERHPFTHQVRCERCENHDSQTADLYESH